MHIQQLGEVANLLGELRAAKEGLAAMKFTEQALCGDDEKVASYTEQPTFLMFFFFSL